MRHLRDFSQKFPGHRFVCQSYDLNGKFMMETTHAHRHGLDMELQAIAACGRWARVQDRETGDVWRP
jgi:hypothetical protein